MDVKGVWGPWSETWNFTARGPAYPLDVEVDYNKLTGVGTLRWKANAAGRSPVKYRVYGAMKRVLRSLIRGPEHRGRHEGGNGGLEPMVPGKLHRRDRGHGTGGDGPRDRTPGSE